MYTRVDPGTPKPECSTNMNQDSCESQDVAPWNRQLLVGHPVVSTPPRDTLYWPLCTLMLYPTHWIFFASRGSHLAGWETQLRIRIRGVDHVDPDPASGSATIASPLLYRGQICMYDCVWMTTGGFMYHALSEWSCCSGNSSDESIRRPATWVSPQSSGFGWARPRDRCGSMAAASNPFINYILLRI